MGMESFNAEPVVPVETERVDDVAKAEEMAYAGKLSRDEAAGDRKIVDGETPIVDNGDYKQVNIDGPLMARFDSNKSNDSIKEEFAQKAVENDQHADHIENIVGEIYDEGKGK